MLVDSTSNSGTASTVTSAIRGAAQATGTSFEYLLATAQVESGFNPHAAASTSSAGGLYQFIDQTWLGMLKEAGPSLGYGRYADAIAKTSPGHYEVSDPAMRQEIMALRKDPTANAAMAGAFTQQNSSKLAAQLGRNPSDGELYIAHFLGPGGAAQLISAAFNSPQASAAPIFPSAAAANHSIFYDKQGVARSASDVYGLLVHRYDSARGSDGPESANVALNAPPIPPASIPTGAPVLPSATAVAAGQAPLTVPPAAFDAATFAAAQSADTSQVFHGLFRTEGHRGPVNPVVQELWGSRSGSLTSDPATKPSSPSTSATKTGLRDLFSDQPANVRALFGDKA
jgi:hypothetical protein